MKCALICWLSFLVWSFCSAFVKRKWTKEYISISSFNTDVIYLFLYCIKVADIHIQNKTVPAQLMETLTTIDIYSNVFISLAVYPTFCYTVYWTPLRLSRAAAVHANPLSAVEVHHAQPAKSLLNYTLLSRLLYQLLCKFSEKSIL